MLNVRYGRHSRLFMPDFLQDNKVDLNRQGGRVSHPEVGGLCRRSGGSGSTTACYITETTVTYQPRRVTHRERTVTFNIKPHLDYSPYRCSPSSRSHCLPFIDRTHALIRILTSNIQHPTSNYSELRYRALRCRCRVRANCSWIEQAIAWRQSVDIGG